MLTAADSLLDEHPAFASKLSYADSQGKSVDVSVTPEKSENRMDIGFQESGLDLTSTQSPQSILSSPTAAFSDSVQRRPEFAGAEMHLHTLITEFDIRLDKLESHLTSFTEQQTKVCQQMQEYMFDLETASESQQRLAMEEIARVERMCAQLELGCQEARDEAFPIQSQMAQFQAQLLTLQVQLEGPHGRCKVAGPTETEAEGQAGEQIAKGDGNKIVDESQVEEYDDEGQALRALDAEVKIARLECTRLASMIDRAAQDYVKCRDDSESLLEDVKGLVGRFEGLQATTEEDVRSLVGRLEGLQASTDAAQVRLEEAMCRNAALAKSEADSLRGSVAEVQSNALETVTALERLQGLCTKLELRGDEIGQLRQALDHLQDGVQNCQAKGEPGVSCQALSSLQDVVQQLIVRVDRLTPSGVVQEHPYLADAQSCEAMLVCSV